MRFRETTPARRAAPERTLRLLLSDTQDEFVEFFQGVLHEVAEPDTTIMTIIPPGVDEMDVVRTATVHSWDIALVLLNNIRYREASAKQIGRFIKQLEGFGRPVIYICAFPWTGDFNLEVCRYIIESGGRWLFSLPAQPRQIRPALRDCIRQRGFPER